MIDKLEKITISGKEYPMACPIKVLCTLQEKFGSLDVFEIKQYGFVCDKSGKIVKKVDPGIEATIFTAARMIEAGIKIQNKTEEKFEGKFNEADLYELSFAEINQIAEKVHSVYANSMKTKN